MREICQPPLIIGQNHEEAAGVDMLVVSPKTVEEHKAALMANWISTIRLTSSNMLYVEAL